jgi:hypothetical protein
VLRRLSTAGSFIGVWDRRCPPGDEYFVPE